MTGEFAGCNRMQKMTVHPDKLPATLQIENTWGAEEVGRFLGFGDDARPGAAALAINVRIARGHPMPPCMTIPHLKSRRWLPSTVMAWAQAYEAPTKSDKSRAQGGRPRKVDLAAMASSRSARAATQRRA